MRNDDKKKKKAAKKKKEKEGKDKLKWGDEGRLKMEVAL